MDWRRLDLNGLKVLHALMVDHAVVRAAERLHLTPSAVSHRLSDLRKEFGDPLFLRTRNGMEPTPRMREIGAAVAAVVASLENATATAFLPAETRTTFHVVATESIISTLVPGLAAALREEAPGSTLHLSLFERRDYSIDLLNGIVDLVLSVGGHTPPSIDVGIAPLLTDELDVLVGPSSPAWGRTELDAEAYLALPHAYSLPWPPEENHLDQVLARRHLRRDIRLVVPHHAAAADAVALSDLALTLPSRVARQFVGCRPNLRAFPCPFPGAGHVAQEWATDRARSGRIAFLRGVLARVVDGMQEQPWRRLPS